MLQSAGILGTSSKNIERQGQHEFDDEKKIFPLHNHLKSSVLL
jgi:hypothetical protein